MQNQTKQHDKTTNQTMQNQTKQHDKTTNQIK